jgi:hypothetical protein
LFIAEMPFLSHLQSDESFEARLDASHSVIKSITAQGQHLRFDKMRVFDQQKKKPATKLLRINSFAAGTIASLGRC